MSFHVPHSVFSSQRIDPGTLLLLENLPSGEPRAFLDLGCGYGALGLPIAAQFPESRGLLLDRDLLAVEYARRNAALNQIEDVETAPSLGYSALAPDRRFDWILANVPARAGGRVVGHFLEGGTARLAEGGEMRVVVIAPLGAAVEEAAAAREVEARRVAVSARHAVYTIACPTGGMPQAPREAGSGEQLDAYERDRIELELPDLPGPLRLVRPTDLADEPPRLPIAIPLLAARFPDAPPARVLVFRCGYGLVAALALARWPEARVTALDRDILGTAYTRLNCSAAGGRMEVLEAIDVAAAASRGPFDLVLGELSPPIGPAATVREIEDARRLLAPGGQGLVLALHKQWREVLGPRRVPLGLDLIERREPVALLGMRGREDGGHRR